jgi:peroxin-4
MNIKRILTELKEIKKHPNKDIILEPLDDSLEQWKAFIKGIGPFQDYYFELQMELKEYPQVAPKITFKTRICHPNIHFETGEICLDLLGEKWSPLYQLQSTLMAIQHMLDEPEPDSPLNCDAAQLLRLGDERGYHSLARMYTRLYAKKTLS